MSGLDLWAEILDTQAALEDALKQTRQRGLAMAEAEAHYYTVKAHTAYDLKEAGQPSTFIALVIKGDPDVNEALEAFHRAEVEYENAREARNVYKKRLDTLREQYQREWTQSGMTA